MDQRKNGNSLSISCLSYPFIIDLSTSRTFTSPLHWIENWMGVHSINDEILGHIWLTLVFPKFDTLTKVYSSNKQKLFPLMVSLNNCKTTSFPSWYSKCHSVIFVCFSAWASWRDQEQRHRQRALPTTSQIALFKWVHVIYDYS